MTDLDLFGRESEEGADDGTLGAGAASDDVDPNAPLAARMRPRTLDDFQGQEQLLGQGKAIRAMLDGGKVASMLSTGVAEIDRALQGLDCLSASPSPLCHSTHNPAGDHPRLLPRDGPPSECVVGAATSRNKRGIARRADSQPGNPPLGIPDDFGAEATRPGFART